MRDDFTQKTRLTLQHRVGCSCSNPDCRRKTTGPNSDISKASSIGVACHITAASPNGPRYDQDLSKEERKSILNGIWLCEICSKMIDVDVNKYPVELLYRWKHQAEAIAKYEYEGKEIPPELLSEGFYCPYCETFVKEGVMFCKGCHSDICYGLTPSEKSESAKSWGCIGLMVGFGLFVVVPVMIKSLLGWSVSDYWGIGIYAFVITMASSFALMLIMPEKEHKERLKLPPRFFKNLSY
ncbi:hypothetical protein [Vibrio algarum]|uniref:Zinc ribbon domain-containing protein n=1 Tax=Vibrio algarum TaxID=3020714 RepID=A0ABT4YLY0_9VIBR|nr:hypothetical protein [Vibrio sp. KJ40-1]MDB1122241.1 hypothetical protein [Vibrio sp. KJ40-1]